MLHSIHVEKLVTSISQKFKCILENKQRAIKCKTAPSIKQNIWCSILLFPFLGVNDINWHKLWSYQYNKNSKTIVEALENKIRDYLKKSTTYFWRLTDKHTYSYLLSLKIEILTSGMSCVCEIISDVPYFCFFSIHITWQ